MIKGRITSLMTFGILTLGILVLSCGPNPFGTPEASNDGFRIFSNDFQNQSDNGMAAELTKVIRSAKVTLDCSFARITRSDIADAIIERAGSGVVVRVGLDFDEADGDTTVQRIIDSALFSREFDLTRRSKLLIGNKGDGATRYNFCVADERRIYFSTAAASDTDMNLIPNVAMILSTEEFGISREFTKELNMMSQGSFGNSKAKLDFDTKFNILNQVIAVHWGPQESPLDILAAELTDARKSIRIYTTQFQTTSTKSERDLPSVLQRRLDRNIPIEIVASSQALFDTDTKLLNFLNTSVQLRQYFNSQNRVGLNFVLIDEGTTDERLIVFAGGFRSRANSSDDGVLFIMKGNLTTSFGRQVFEILRSQSTQISTTPTNIATPNQREVVINEIGWMGSIANDASADANDEFIELYNRSSSAINLSGWKFACTTNGTSINSLITIPTGVSIPAQGYLVLAKYVDRAIPSASVALDISITNSSRECTLTDGDAVDNASGLYSSASFTGTIVDVAGDNSTAFSSNPAFGSSSSSVKRSMERIDPASSGGVLANWRSNPFTASANPYIASLYRNATFGSPGFPNNPVVTSVEINRSLVFGTSAIHPNGVLKITVQDSSANQNAGAIETVQVRATSNSDSTGVLLTLTETAAVTGIFTSVATGTNLNFTTGASSGNQLQVNSGDTITVTYLANSTSYTATANWFAQNLVLNEIGKNCNGDTSSDYVEIYNPNAQAVTLTNVRLLRDSGTGSSICDITSGDWTTSVNLSGSLSATGYAIIAGVNYTTSSPSCPAPTIRSSSDVTINDNDCLALIVGSSVPISSTDDPVIDFIGYGNAGNPREGGAVATDIGSSTSQECLLRNPNGTDTNQNGTDFSQAATTNCNPGGPNFPFNAVSAIANASDRVHIRFNRAPQSASAQTSGNYTISGGSGLTVSAAVLSGNVVTLTTSAQTQGTAYTVSISNVIANSDSAALTTSTADFSGYVPLVINEIGISSASNDFVELYNAGTVSIDLGSLGYSLIRDSACNLGNGVTENLNLTGTIAAGAYFVLANSGHSLSGVNASTLGNLASGYCVILMRNATTVSAATEPNVMDWVTIAGSGDTENGVRAPDTGANGTISRIPNGTDTNMNNADFAVSPASVSFLNGTPVLTSTPANSASGVAITSNIVLQFSVSMNTGVGTVNLSGTSSGAQNGLTCAWSTTTMTNDTCTINPSDFTANGETVSVTLVSFASTNAVAPNTTAFSFTTTDPALVPTVTNVVVASTLPNNGTTPYNTGTATLTITGTNFTGVSCPSGVRVDDPNATVASSCTVDSGTQITATLPAGIRTNGNTGWNVIVTNGNGSNATSSVRFIPRAGLLITEIGDALGGTGANDYIEIFNPTAAAISLSSYRWLRDGNCDISGSWTQSNVTFGAVSSIPARSYLLISRTSNTISGDLTTLGSIANNHCVALTFGGTAPTSPTGGNIIDFVSFGTVTDSENSSIAPALPSNGAIRRNGTCKITDTDANASDFTAVPTPVNPNNSATAACP